jgi:hypothetical protein
MYGERSEPIPLRFEYPVRMIEALGIKRQGHRANRGKHRVLAYDRNGAKPN